MQFLKFKKLSINVARLRNIERIYYLGTKVSAVTGFTVDLSFSLTQHTTIYSLVAQLGNKLL